MTSTKAYANTVELVSVTGTRLADSQISLTNSLSRAEIELINPSSTIELLARLPHVNISTNGDTGGYSYLSIRGGEFNFTLVTIDGIAVNDSTNSRGGGFDFNQINPSAIERIEVYRGGSNTVHAGDAISGVINIITRRKAPTTASFTLGNNEQVNASLTHSLKVNTSTEVLLSASSQNKDKSSFEQLNSHQLLAKLSSEQEHFNVDALLTYNQADVKGFAEDSGGNLFASPKESEERDSEQWLASLSGVYQVNPVFVLNARASFISRVEDIDNPGIDEGFFSAIPPSDVRSDYTRTEADIFARWQFGASSSLVAGVQSRRQSAKNRGEVDFGVVLPVNYDLEQNMHSAYVEAQTTWNDFVLEASARYDSPTRFDKELSTRFGFSFNSSEQSRVFASVNQGYKLPSFFALAHPLVGNPDLQPEKSTNIEIGFSAQITSYSDFSLVYFENQFTDLVDFDSELFTNVNRQSVDSAGLELDLVSKLSNTLSFEMNVSYTDLDVAEGVRLRKRPNWQGNTQLVYTRENIQATLFIDYRDDYLDSAIPTGYVRLEGGTQIGASASWQFLPNSTLSLSINNLTGQKIEDAIGFINEEPDIRLAFTHIFSQR